MQIYELLNSVTDIGYHMLEQGAEVYRVEDSLRRIFASYEIPAEVYAVPGSVIVTIHDEDGRPMTKTRRILLHDTNLDKVDRLNDLSRRVCRDRPEPQQIREEIKAILARRSYPAPILVFAYIIIGFSFALFFEGDINDALVAGVTGGLIKLLQLALAKVRSNEFFVIILCSAMTSFIAIVSVQLGLANNIDKVTIGALMTLVPGITVTNCMRDFIAGDFMTGLSRLAQALLAATAIAAGVAINMTLLRPYI